MKITISRFGPPMPPLAGDVLRRAGCLRLARLALGTITTEELIAAANYLDRGWPTDTAAVDDVDDELDRIRGQR